MKIFYLPDLGEGLAEAEIHEWYVKEGDAVKVDQPLVSMETAKAIVDVPSLYEGTITKLHGAVNEIVKTGAPLITFDVVEEFVSDKPKGTVVGSLEESTTQWQEAELIIGSPQAKKIPIKAMPAARVLANQMGVDLYDIKASHSNGWITPADVKKHLETLNPAMPTTIQGEKEALRGVRRTMAQIMSKSHQEVVPVTVIEEADISHLPPKTDITSKLLNAIAAAVGIEPSLNAWFDGKSLERTLFKEVNIGLAVDTAEGLFVPVIRGVENLSAEGLRAEINRYKTQVKDRSVPREDLTGATFTLSNFGMIAGRYATPIIVPPMVAILGCGRIMEKVIPQQNKIVVGRVLPLSLSFDHRAVTGGEATRFLGAIIDFLQKE